VSEGTVSTKGTIELRIIDDYNQARQRAEEYVSTNNKVSKELKDLVSTSGAAAKATNTAAAATKAHTTSLIATRYALYDVSTNLAIGGAAMLAFSAIAFKTAIDYQKDFAQVARTTGVVGTEATKLNDTLLALTQTMPASFADVTTIAAAAGQLGIATNQVGDFTKSVIEFSSTTNVSVDQSATAFGRLNALLPDVKGNYNALGSSILNVGVNTVATESQIVAISSRIAGIGSSVGLTSSQIIGLSGALASIGIQPELAQGSITRVFTKIQVAVSQGGAALEQFGRVSGTTGDQFKAAFQADPTAAFGTLLSGINAQGPGAIEALKSLGITSARDIPTFLKLSQNVGLYTDSLNLAADGTKNATKLGENYAITSQTVAAKLTVLSNSFKTLLADLGKGAASAGGFLDSITGFVTALDSIAKNPAEAGLASFVLALVGLTGVVGIAAAAFFRLAAARAAFTTAALATSASTGIVATAFQILTTGTIAQTAANGGLTASTGVVTTAMGAESAAAQILAISLKAIAVVGLVLVASKVAGALHDQAIQALGLATSIDSATTALDKFNKKTITKDLGLDKGSLIRKPGTGVDLGQTAGALYGSVAGRASNPGVVQGQDFNSTFGNTLGFANISQNIEKYDKVLTALVNGGHAKQAATEFKFITDASVAQGAKLKDVQAQFPLYAAAVKVGSDAAAAASKEGKAYTDSVAGQTQAIKDAVGSITDAANSIATIQGALFTLGGTLQASGNDFSAYSEKGRANLSSLEGVMAGYVADAGGNSQILASNLQGLFNALTQGAGVPAAALSVLSDAIASLGVKGIQPSAINLSSLTQGFGKAQAAADKTAASANKAANAVHTLVDYASELSGVFNRAFEIRFSGSQGLDAISSGWSKIRDAIAATNTQIKGYQDTMLSLSADKKINEYWLTVANNYGDTLRAGTLQASIAKNNSDLAANQSSLTDATAASSKELNGNSDAAIANRSEILGLVKNYQGYIAALASSGASQATLSTKTAQLKADFIAQGTQLGYSRAELGQYASAFDDVALAISKVPRSINVTANINPALQALAEFDAKATAQANKSYSGGTITSPTYDDTGAAKNARLQTLQAEMSMLTKSLGQTGSSISPQYATDRIKAISTAINAGQYYNGGYTGDGGKYETAGIAHKGEFYFTKEQTASIGRSNLESLAHSFRMPAAAPAIISAPSDGAQRPLELSQYDRGLLINIANRVGITLSGNAIQQANGLGNVNNTKRGTS
jgi:TP901 family phage tail tape measure protein